MAMTTASAQEWDWQVTPYLWGAGVDGDIAIGPVAQDVDIEFSDIVDVLAGAALFRVEGGNDENAFLADFVWLRLEPNEEIATVGGVAQAEFDSVILETSYLRKFDRIDLELGARYWDMELEIDPALLPEIVRDDSWTDAYIGFRLVRELSEKWSLQVRVNAGAGGSDSTLAAESHFGRKFDSGNQLVFGLKTIMIDYYESSVNGVPFNVDTMFLGGTIGYLFD
jgi:hypothetical protein